MNRVVISGRVAKDLELRYTQGQEQMAILKFPLAVKRTGKKDETDFISCTAFGKTAESMNKWTEKGLRLTVEGHIQTGSYTNREGQKVYTTDVIVDNAEFIDYKLQTNPQVVPADAHQATQWHDARMAEIEQHRQEKAQQQGYQAQQQPSQYQQAQWQQAAQEGFMQPDPLSDEGLPFGN